MKLAIDGGTPVRADKMPERGLLTRDDLAAVTRLFEAAMAEGQALGYAGEQEALFCEEFCAFMGGGLADGLSSGSAACMAALAGLDLEPFGEVIVPPMTDPGPVMAVALMGCVPVPADGDLRTFNISAEGVSARLTSRTRAVMVAHIPGEPVDMDAILAVTRAAGLPVIEDCSQAHGARYKGRFVGTFGAVSFFSTMFTKHMCTGGQGGILFTRDPEIHRRAKLFANRGKPFGPGSDPDQRECLGLNLNMDEIAAAIGRSQLRRLPETIARRREIAEAVRQGLDPEGAVSFGWQPEGGEASLWFLRLGLDTSRLRVDKERFCAALTAEGLRASPHLPIMPTEKGWYRNRRTLGSSGFPWTCAEYQGPRVPDYPIPRTIQAEAGHFRVGFHERWTLREVEDLLAAVAKVQKAYAA